VRAVFEDSLTNRMDDGVQVKVDKVNRFFFQKGFRGELTAFYEFNRGFKVVETVVEKTRDTHL